MTVREKLEIEMDKEENADSEKSDKNNISDNCNSVDSVRSY